MLKGHFIESPKGRLFVTQFGRAITKKSILCLPSITEELNLSRAVVAKQASEFARTDIACVVVDYIGTGDSEGVFEQVSVSDWLDNIITVGNWLLAQGAEEIILWGIRFGALLALSHQKMIHQRLPIVAQIYWKPILKGRQFSEQMLRLKNINSCINGQSVKHSWRDEAAKGHHIEIGGYLYTDQMLQSIDKLVVDVNNKPISAMSWLELGSEKLTPILNKIETNWSTETFNIICHPCPHFWHVPEIFTLPELFILTIGQLRGKGTP